MTFFKAFGLILAAIVLAHWLTAGQDEIIKGPPQDLGGISTIYVPSNK